MKTIIKTIIINSTMAEISRNVMQRNGVVGRVIHANSMALSAAVKREETLKTKHE